MRAARGLPFLLAVVALTALASTALAADPYQATPRCDVVRLRTGPSTAYPTKVTIDHTTDVTVGAEVKGSYWSTKCGKATYSGSRWARIVELDGVSVQDAYGVKALFAALGLLSASATTPPPTETPTSSATPGGSANPTVPPSDSPTTKPSAAGASDTPGPGSSGQVPASAAPGSPSPAPAGAGSSSAIGSVGDLVVLGLALTSVFLAGVLFGEHRRPRASNKVPSSRLNDVLE